MTGVVRQMTDILQQRGIRTTHMSRRTGRQISHLLQLLGLACGPSVSTPLKTYLRYFGELQLQCQYYRSVTDVPTSSLAVSVSVSSGLPLDPLVWSTRCIQCDTSRMSVNSSGLATLQIVEQPAEVGSGHTDGRLGLYPGPAVRVRLIPPLCLVWSTARSVHARVEHLDELHNNEREAVISCLSNWTVVVLLPMLTPERSGRDASGVNKGLLW